jgi:CTP synthase (UTP-ammonia lyase)
LAVPPQTPVIVAACVPAICDARMIALVGDYSEQVPAHRAIPRALEMARTELGANLAWRWIPTGTLADASRTLADCTAIWLVPASPYANMDGALAAIRFARETRRPFLGTCGGFQHALIEYARNVAGLPDADHTETNPAARVPVIARLNTSMEEKTADIHFAPASRLREIYDATSACEGYHCNYGLNAAYRDVLQATGLNFTAFDAAGDVRAAEIPKATHPFFIGTLFQPERIALQGRLPPLVRAFASASVAGR